MIANRSQLPVKTKEKQAEKIRFINMVNSCCVVVYISRGNITFWLRWQFKEYSSRLATSTFLPLIRSLDLFRWCMLNIYFTSISGDIELIKCFFAKCCCYSFANRCNMHHVFHNTSTSNITWYNVYCNCKMNLKMSLFLIKLN